MSDAFGRRLRAFRKLKLLTQAELAEELGVSLSIVGSLERGTRSPNPEILRKLATALQVSEPELLGNGR